MQRTLNLFKPFVAGTVKRTFHRSIIVQGFDEFVETKKATEVVTTGRAWTAADVRRKSFEDLHKLWFVLYKERNLLLSEREKSRRLGKPIGPHEEFRYTKVKKSMAAIKVVLTERRKISLVLKTAEEGGGGGVEGDAVKRLV